MLHNLITIQYHCMPIWIYQFWPAYNTYQTNCSISITELHKNPRRSFPVRAGAFCPILTLETPPKEQGKHLELPILTSPRLPYCLALGGPPLSTSPFCIAPFGAGNLSPLIAQESHGWNSSYLTWDISRLNF